MILLKSGLTLSYVSQGDRADVAVVMLPGPTDSWRSYQPILESMPRAIRVIAVSPRGHGDSDKPPTGYRVEDFAADVVPLLDALGVERAVLVGHSGSCLAVRRVALDHPRRVAGLILEASPTTMRSDAGLREFVTSVVSNLEDPISPEFARRFVVDTSSIRVPPELLDHLVDELLKVPARVWQATFAGLLQYDDRSELGRITAPTLLVWGDSDALVSRSMQDELVKCIPGAELRVYPQSGHTPRWDEPTRFAADVAAFAMRFCA